MTAVILQQNWFKENPPPSSRDSGCFAYDTLLSLKQLHESATKVQEKIFTLSQNNGTEEEKHVELNPFNNIDCVAAKKNCL